MDEIVFLLCVNHKTEIAKICIARLENGKTQKSPLSSIICQSCPLEEKRLSSPTAFREHLRNAVRK